jgi:hypothetical protein
LAGTLAGAAAPAPLKTSKTIRADINGDGVAELVPLNDRAGPTTPQHPAAPRPLIQGFFSFASASRAFSFVGSSCSDFS